MSKSTDYNKAVEYMENVDEVESKILKQHLKCTDKPKKKSKKNEKGKVDIQRR